MTRTRPPAVAGSFYPADPGVLRQSVETWLAEARPHGRRPKAFVLPHAGHVYSGSIAATGHAYLARDALAAEQNAPVETVVLLGPSHRVAFRGIGVSRAEVFETPLGPIPVDRDAVERALTLPQVHVRDAAHAAEHSLEVHLPFLQVALGEFRLAPFVVGSAEPDEVAALLDLLWGGEETVVVVSSDLSHYLPYEEARARDRRTAEAVEEVRGEKLGGEDACGVVPLRGLLEVAHARGLTIETADLRSSGDTAGPRDAVVGYGAFLFRAPSAPTT